METLKRFSKPVATGFAELDELMEGGFFPGYLVLLAGQPESGKTALLGQIARHVTLHGGQLVIFFSLELEADALRLRLAQDTVSAAAPQGPLEQAMQELADASLCVLAEALSPEEMGERCQELALSQGRLPSLVVVHGLSRVIPLLGQERSLALNAAAGVFKRLAKDLKTAVLVSDTLLGSGGEVPGFEDMPEFDGFIGAADMVWLLPPAGELSQVALHVAKNRHGPCETLSLPLYKNA
ncbi:MAG: DnaB-like helicase C-terminal domain-containing protein [Candidatus Sericytochromatia bacterium]